MRATLLVALVALGLSWCMPLLGQTRGCDPRIDAVSGSIGYKARSSDHRCEGFFIAPVGSVPVEIVSFTRGTLSLLADSKPVSISLAARERPAAGKPLVAPVLIRAAALPAGLNYRLDGEIVDNEDLRWPLQDVVVPSGLKPKQIGILAYVVNEAGSLTYMPVSVQPSRGAQVRAATYTLILKTAGTVTDAKWALDPAVAPGVDVGFEEHGNELELTLPADAHQLKRRFTVNWNDGNGTPRVRQFLLYF